MKISQFADRHRLKIKRDESGVTIIPGKFGHIYNNDDGRYGVMYMPDEDGSNPTDPSSWGHIMRSLGSSKHKFEIALDCDGEGIGLFDPHNDKQAKQAIVVAGIKRKRIARKGLG